jgi:hypothetical protein
MSRSMSLYSSQKIDPAEFIRFIHELGGQILDEDELDASVSFDECCVWFYGVRRALQGDFEQAEEAVEAKLGHPLQVRVDLHLSHHDGSEPLAMSIAHAFALRWRAVAAYVAYQVMTAVDLERSVLAHAHVPALLGSEIRILAITEPQIRCMINELAGLSIDATDGCMVASAATEIGKLSGGDFDKDRELILGLIPVNDDYIWIMLHKLEDNGGGDGGPCTLVLQKLGESPTCMIRVLFGSGSTDSVKRLALAIASRILQLAEGVLVGTFSLILDAAEIAEMRRHGSGFLAR